MATSARGARSAARAGRGARLAAAAYTLKEPPYALDALEPHMSKSTMEFHWGKHHQTYVNNINTATEGKPEADLSVEDLMLKAWKEGAGGLFNNAGQVWNHDFFWEGMKPNGGGQPSGKLMDMIVASFGSFDEFAAKFKAAGAPGPAFGSGWIWLVENGGALEIQFTSNAENPLASGTGKPLLTYDVWEHAYYLDHQNLRPRYIETFMEHLVNWDKVAERLG